MQYQWEGQALAEVTSQTMLHARWGAGGVSADPPASSWCQVDLKVGDDSVQQRLYERDRKPHYGRGYDKGPSWEEVVVPLFEEDRKTLNLHGK